MYNLIYFKLLINYYQFVINTYILRPGTQYRVNTRIRDGEVNLDNSTVEEETYGSVRDRIAGFNKALNTIIKLLKPLRRWQCTQDRLLMLIFKIKTIFYSNIRPVKMIVLHSITHTIQCLWNGSHGKLTREKTWFVVLNDAKLIDFK